MAWKFKKLTEVSSAKKQMSQISKSDIYSWSIAMDILNMLLTQLCTLALSSLKCLTSLIIFIISLRNKMASSLR